ncbi:lytic transglycosylase domain-containing protein [Xanthomonas graminis]|uniref:Soluble lytic murein transglycosylase n=1 Tax=Xanthomonas graminis pv. graminis TaxID=134874 RepID=A0A1M4JIM2_9XANT|nr:lytic transglycosylase domain-containing protein [Xanthomonas translucens]OAX60568.1 transglycosylase [Xanthomonas translucens pv. graminis]UKE55751.1 lytic transglycosylase domain-containing protein [Xanthomonas translucens pv. graminis]WIH13527.1 lytic transglycosylase domain-containing protein [Xanthomonas translucens pv. graminis]WIH14794.1 lytic transglycosylase domain-containing protein [Xanthomonas translucens pv. graminis]SBV42326.1 soluble lytic murein transglycosylase [Xanthomonas
MKGMARLVGLAIATLSVMPASAGTLYKCIGGDGVPSYGGKRVAGATCSVVGRYAPERRAGRAAPALAPASAERAPSRGGIALAAAQAGAPATIISRPPVTAPVAASVAPTRVAPVPAMAGTAPRRVVSGQVYSYMKDGVRHYTSARPTQVASLGTLRTIHYSFIETCYACANPGLNFGAVRLNTTAYQSEIAAAAREYGVDEAVVRAIIHAESAYNPMALSRAGAQGLMQLMPPTASRFGVRDAFDAAQNIRGGVQYLAWLLKRFNGNLSLAAAGYNAGEGAVDKHGGVPPYSETQRYVQRVGVLADRYRGVLAAAH